MDADTAENRNELCSKRSFDCSFICVQPLSLRKARKPRAALQKAKSSARVIHSVNSGRPASIKYLLVLTLPTPRSRLDYEARQEESCLSRSDSNRRGSSNRRP